MGSYGNQYYGENYYIDGGDNDSKNLKAMMDHYYNSSYPQNAAYWMQGSIDKRFKAGDQTLYSMAYGDNNFAMNRRYFFNLIRRHINMIAGHQRKNRKSTITLPSHEGDDALTDEYNTVMKWCDDRDGFQEYFSQAFEGGCDTGCSLLHMYPDYTLDPISGDLFTDQVAYNNFLIDPYWRKMDFTDCAFIWRRRWVNRNAAKSLLPGHAKEIEKLKAVGMKDGRFPLQAELLNLDTNQLFTYDEFYYRTTREGTIILDPKTGESAEWEDNEEEPEGMMEMVLKQQPWLMIKKTQIPTVKLCICIAGKPLYDGPNLLNIDPYPFVPLVTYHEPDIQSYQWRMQGIVRGLRDAQFLYNSRVCIMEDILRSQINSGWIYPVDAVTDPKAFRQSGQGFLIPLKTGHLPNEIQRVDAPNIPPSMIELSMALEQLITKVSGVNEELLGSATDDKSGILSMLRQGASLTTLQTIFDKADYSQRLYGKIRLAAIKKNFTSGKISAILGHKPDERFFSTHALKYNITVEEGNYAASQRQTELQQLLYFKGELGMPISNKSILRCAIITDKKRVIQEMEEEQQQQQQAQQAQSEQEAKKLNADVMTKYAKSKLDLAKEKESMAKTQETIAKIDQTEADAEHKRMQSDLELVKMMVELEDMDLANFRNSLEMAEAIKVTNGGKSNHPLYKEEIITNP